MAFLSQTSADQTSGIVSAIRESVDFKVDHFRDTIFPYPNIIPSFNLMVGDVQLSVNGMTVVNDHEHSASWSLSLEDTDGSGDRLSFEFLVRQSGSFMSLSAVRDGRTFSFDLGFESLSATIPYIEAVFARLSRVLDVELGSVGKNLCPLALACVFFKHSAGDGYVGIMGHSLHAMQAVSDSKLRVMGSPNFSVVTVLVPDSSFDAYRADDNVRVLCGVVDDYAGNAEVFTGDFSATDSLVDGIPYTRLAVRVPAVSVPRIVRTGDLVCERENFDFGFDSNASKVFKFFEIHSHDVPFGFSVSPAV